VVVTLNWGKRLGGGVEERRGAAVQAA